MTPMSSRGRRFFLIVIVTIICLVLAVALWPASVDGDGRLVYAILIQLHALGVPGWVDYAMVERAANVLLFVPIGWGAAMLLRHWWIAVPGAAALSIAFELAQLLLTARDASPSDVLMNTAGATIGAAAVGIARAIRRRRGVAEAAAKPPQ